jgi:hypothetical protein
VTVALAPGATVLTAREALLRSLAAGCLAGIALLQAIALPVAVRDDGALAVLVVAAIGVCVASAWALAVAPAGAARPLWSVIAADAILILAGWAATRAFALGPAGRAGGWTAMPGGACAALAAGCLALAAAAAPPRRSAAPALGVAAAVVLALGPSVGAVLVALGPGPAAGETALGSSAHVHPGGGDTSLEFRARAGGRGGAFVYPTVGSPHPTPVSAALLAVPALVFVAGAVGHLRRRAAARSPAADPSRVSA